MTKQFNKTTLEMDDCLDSDVLEITNDVLNNTADFYLAISDDDFKNLEKLNFSNLDNLFFIQNKKAVNKNDNIMEWFND